MKKKIKIVVLLIILICSIVVIGYYIYQNNKGKFKKYANNPVLGDETTGVLFDPNVIEIDNTLYMYVSNRNKKCIEVYKSYDGIKWEEGKEVLTFTLETGWEDDINRCCVIYQNGKYKMWYTGQKQRRSKIGYAESDNGYEFYRVQDAPVIIPAEEYEGISVMNPYVMYDEAKQTYRMWYSAGENLEPDVIAYAESKDGIAWEKYKDNPIYQKDTKPEAYDSYKIGGCEVKLFNNEYYMFYIGYTNIDTAYIMCAKSNDGITNWEKISEKPLVSPTKGSFDSDACYKPTTYYNHSNNTLMLWYNGRNKEKEYIGLATYELKN